MHQLRIETVLVTLLLGAKIEAWLLKHRGDPTPRWVQATNQGSRGSVHNLGASTQDADSRLHRRLLESLRVELRGEGSSFSKTSDPFNFPSMPRLERQLFTREGDGVFNTQKWSRWFVYQELNGSLTELGSSGGRRQDL